jgi:hypothetical protein
VSIQLPLPAAWARELESLREEDPHDRLQAIDKDKHQVKAEIRETFDKFADRHGVSARTIHYVMQDYIDDAVDELVCEVRSLLNRRLESRPDKAT